MEILLLVSKMFFFVLEVTFGLWKLLKEKTLDAEIIQRLQHLEKEVKKLKS